MAKQGGPGFFFMKRILFLENGVTGGGSFDSLTQLVLNLDTEKYEPHVVFVNKTRFFDQCKDAGIQTYLLKDPLYTGLKLSVPRRAWFHAWHMLEKIHPRFWKISERMIHCTSMLRLRRIMRKANIDLVHVNDQPVRDLYAIILARSLRIPCVSFIRSDRAGKLSSYKKRFLNEVVDVFVANSHYIKERWVHRGLKAENVVVVHNAITQEKVAAPAVMDNQGFVLGCVSQFRKGKGHAFLLRAFRKIVKMRKNVHLLLVGDGPLLEDAKKLASRLNIEMSVTFCGYQNNPLEWIKKMDLFILPSEDEPFGRVVLEAMLMNVPVVATNGGGVPEIITHEKTGLLVEYNKDDELSAAVFRCLDDEELRSRFARSGRELVEREFSIEAHVKRVENVYDNSLC